MYLSRIVSPLLEFIKPQYGALKNFKLAENVTKRFNSTASTTASNSKSPEVNPIEEFENKTNNEFSETKSTKSEKKSFESEKQKELETHPFGIAQANHNKYFGWQPNKETHSLLMIDGVPYNKTNIVYIKSSKNNTILSLTDHNGLTLYSISAGACGFKNCKKSTAVAGQAAGLAMSDNIKRRGIKNLRVMVKGFGNGRLPAIKALQMSKLQIVSITDQTPIPLLFSKPPRPPVKRRI